MYYYLARYEQNNFIHTLFEIPFTTAAMRFFERKAIFEVVDPHPLTVSVAPLKS